MFHCLHLLKAQTFKGGTSPVLRPDRTGDQRESIYIELDEGDTTKPSFVEGRVIGFSQYYNNQPFEYGCFEPSCFLGSGTWTLAYVNELVESLSTTTKAVEDGCIEDCFEDFNQVCRVQLPYDYEGPLKYYITEEGKFTLVDVNQEYCEQEPVVHTPPTSDPFIKGSYIEGFKAYITYEGESYTLAIEEREEDYLVYILMPENECLDECSFSRLAPIGSYTKDTGEERHTLFSTFLERTLFTNDVLIDNEYLLYVNDHLESTYFNSPTRIDSNYYLNNNNPADNPIDLYRYTIPTLNSLSIAVDEVEAQARNVIDKHIELESYRREFNPLHKCIRYCNNRITEINGVEVRYSSSYEVWVEGVKDLEGYIYVADIGYIHPLNHEMVVWDRNIPLTTGGRFKSNKLIPAGPKMIKIKRIDRYSETVILHHITPTHNLRSSTGHLLNYNAKDQEVDLEKTSMTMINILLSSYTQEEECVFHIEKNVIDPYLLSSTKNTIDFLLSLISKESNTYGSIPKQVATYSDYRSIYQNPRYLDPFVKPFEDGVFSEDCFLEEEDRTLISRTIDNRAICWFLYSLCTYIEVTHDKSYMPYLSRVAQYLIEQRNKADLLSTGYDSNLNKIEEYRSSYSIMFVLTMMRLHDLTLDNSYIDAAADTYISLDKYLYLKQNDLYSHSYESIETSTESLVYGFLYSLEINKEDCLESTLKTLKARVKSKDPFDYPKSITTLSGGIVVNKNNRPLKSSKKRKNISLSEERYLPIYSEGYDTVEHSYILDTCFRALQARNRTYPSSIHGYLQTLIETQAQERHITSSILLSYCLDDGVVSHPLFRNHSLYDLETLLFHRRFIEEKLLTIPKNYTWFEESALKPGGLMGSILKTFSKSLSNWYVGMRRLKKGTSLSQAEDSYLEQWAELVNLKRHLQEDQDSHRDRIRSLLTLIGVTKNRLEEALLAQGIKISIEETPILAPNGYLEKPYSTQGDIQGSEVNASSIHVQTERMEEEHRLYFESLLPLGVKPLYKERIALYDCGNWERESYLSFNESLHNFSYEVKCCPEMSNVFYVTVEVENTYPTPLYIYGYNTLDEDFVVDINHEHKSEGLLGLIRTGDQSGIFRVERSSLPTIGE